MDLDVACTQRGRDLKPNKSCTQYDCPARCSGSFDNGATVRKRAQRAYVRLVGTWIGRRTGSAPVASNSRS